MLSVPEGEDRHFEYRIQHGAPSTHRLLVSQGPGSEAKCLSLVAHIGMGSLFWPIVACGKAAASFKVINVYCKKSEPWIWGTFECLQFYLCNSI